MTFRRRFYVIIGVGLRFDDISPQYSIIFIQKNDTKKKLYKNILELVASMGHSFI